MVPYMETVVRERQQRFVDEAAWQRRLARSRTERRTRVRQAVAQALVATGQRLGAGRRLGTANPAATLGCRS